MRHVKMQVVLDLRVQQGPELAQLPELSLSPLSVFCSVAEIFRMEAAFTCTVRYYVQTFTAFKHVPPLHGSR